MYEKIHVNLDMRESGQAHYGRNFTSLSKNDKASFLILYNWNMIWYANKSTILIGNGKNYYFVSQDEMMADIAANEYLEYGKYL